MNDTKNILDQFLLECPVWIIDKSVEYLKSFLSVETIANIIKAHSDDPAEWWAIEHFGWGMYIRNSLRDNVFKDDELPSKNWDDYYVQFVELACGIR